jgi:hypothetical protein
VPEWRDSYRYDQSRPAWTDQKIDVALSDGSHWLGIENKIYYRQILVTAGAGQAAAVEVHLVDQI